MDRSAERATLIVSKDDKTLRCDGAWTIRGCEAIANQLRRLKAKFPDVINLDASGITQFDSAGALMLQGIITAAHKMGHDLKISGLNSQYLSLLGLVSEDSQSLAPPEELKHTSGALFTIGEWSIDKYIQLMAFLAFVGEVFVNIGKNIVNPGRIQWRATLRSVEKNGYDALPIIALLSFLIGMVLAYQLAEQLKVYGADIFIVDVTGIAILREFGPLMTAIILAGRTSTSFAALIGTMKVNEEIDALNTMGISPVERLVLPRIFGILISLPLLVVWADIFGIMGSMVMAKSMLGISYYAYMERFEFAVGISHYVLGMIKTPVFAIIIAAVGCFQGFQTQLNAESVGKKTTQAAVQTIFLIIIIDALFSIIFSELGY